MDSQTYNVLVVARNATARSQRVWHVTVCLLYFFYCAFHQVTVGVLLVVLKSSLHQCQSYAKDDSYRMLKQGRTLFARTSFHGFCTALAFTALCLALNDVHAVDPDLSKVEQTDASDEPQVLAEKFSLPATDGSVLLVGSDPSVSCQVVCFLGAECPLANLYAPRLNGLATEFNDRGVRFVGINSNLQDSMQDLAAYVKKHDLVFPMVKDYDRAAALGFGASRTPEVFVVDGSGVIRYRGRIDDQYRPGLLRPKLERQDLRLAVEQLLSGERVAIPRTEATGCLISLPREVDEKSEVSFCNQISRILQQNCVECHCRGRIGPFALDQYDEVIGWADMSLEVMDQGRMPPWHASDGREMFSNARQLSDADKLLFRKWVEAGTPYGDPSQLKPIVADPTHGDWPVQPDLILGMPQPYEVPAELAPSKLNQGVAYQYSVLDPGFEEERWLSTVMLRPGDPRVVHHAMLLLRLPDGNEISFPTLISGHVPGQMASEVREGHAIRVPAGAKFVLQMHYTPCGTATSDLTEVGLVFTDRKKVTHEVLSLFGINPDFEIPKGAANHVVKGSVNYFPRGGVLLAVTPHMHVRGKSFSFELQRGDQVQSVLEVPRYDFGWQHRYELADPIPLQDVTEMQFTAVFDNSAGNPVNPDPKETVFWGDQTWEEMALAIVTVAIPVNETSAEKQADMQSQPGLLQDRKAKDRKAASDYAERYVARLDANGDGVLTKGEMPRSVPYRVFWRMSGNDGSLTIQDVRREYLKRRSGR